MNRAYQAILTIILLAALVGLLDAKFHFARMITRNNALSQRELATQFLGHYLADKFPGKKVVVLANPFTQLKRQKREIYQYDEAGRRGLRKGMGRRANPEVAYLDVRPDYFTNPASVYIDPTTTTPLSYLVTDQSLDAVMGRHPDAEVVVSLIGLPLNVTQTQAWRAPRAPRFALLLPDLSMLGGRGEIEAAFRSGKIVAAVFNRPGAPAEDRPLGSDYVKEFESRFVFVTSESFGQVLKDYPKLF
jgi:hypothetical protein